MPEHLRLQKSLRVLPQHTVISKSIIRKGAGKYSPQRKSTLTALFSHSKGQKKYKGTLGTKELTADLQKVQEQPGSFNGLDMTFEKDLIIFELLSHCFYLFVHLKLSSPSECFGKLAHNCTISRLLDPEMDPVRLI